jgi:hypothetical protein
MLVGSGISADEIMMAFQTAEAQMDAAGLGRYAKMVAVGAKNRDVKLEAIDLASVPDGFDFEKAITLGMFSIALAFGVDARELWPASASGATKADALVQHMKARGKAFGSIVEKIKDEFERKMLPAHLQMVFDQQDDEADASKAEIIAQRSESRMRDIQSGIISARTARVQMLEDGEINESQFGSLEAEDGRLPDGQPLSILFSSPDPDVRAMLGDLTADATEEELDEAISRVEPLLFAARNTKERETVDQVLALLRKLRDEINGSADRMGTSTLSDPQSLAMTPVRPQEANESMSLVGEKSVSMAEFQAMAVAAQRVLSRGE